MVPMSRGGLSLAAAWEDFFVPRFTTFLTTLGLDSPARCDLCLLVVPREDGSARSDGAPFFFLAPLIDRVVDAKEFMSVARWKQISLRSTLNSCVVQCSLVYECPRDSRTTSGADVLIV